jgi:hypothetical protein
MQENFVVLCAGAAESAELTPQVDWADFPLARWVSSTRNHQIGPIWFPTMIRPIWMIGGLPYCSIHVIQIPKLMKCSTECRVCFAPWVKSENCRRHLAEVFRIWSSKNGYEKTL